MHRIPLLALAFLLVPTIARAGDFVDTRIAFTLTDENLLVKPGETNPSVPGLRIDRPNVFGLMFFDNYDTRYTGFENVSHLVLHKRMEGKHLEGESAIVFRFLGFSDVSLSTIDAGSYVKVAYYFDETRQSKSNVSFTAFPLSADRMRLGYSYRLSWGGSPIFFKYNPDLPTTAQVPVNPNPAPGARLAYTGDRFQVWAGFKTSTILNRNPTVNELIAIYGALGGASVDIIRDHLRLEVNGGYFYRGTNPLFYSTQDVSGGRDYKDFPVHSAGASIQLSAWGGYRPSSSADYALYRNDPASASRYFQKFDYKPGFNWLAQAEFTMTTTSLMDPENVSTTKQQLAYAGDVNIRIQKGRSRAKADFSMRSLEFMLMNQPSLVPYQAFPQNSQISPDRFISVGYDYFFERIGLTAGLTAGIDFPATFTPPAAPQGGEGYCPSTGGASCTSATIVVRGEGDYSILPEKDSKGKTVEAMPVYAGKLTLREDFLDYFAAILDVYASYDPNQTHLTKDAAGNQVRDFNHPALLGFNLSLQARF